MFVLTLIRPDVLHALDDGAVVAVTVLPAARVSSLSFPEFPFFFCKYGSPCMFTFL